MGGGGDDGYAAKQEEIERKKQEAREKLNYQFGYGGGGAGRTLDKTPYMKLVEGGPLVSYTGAEGSADILAPASKQSVLDEAAYKAAQAKADAEAEKINPNKAARDQLYQTVRDNAFGTGRRRLDETRDDAARDLKFELFAKGLAGGSEDIDQNTRLGRTYSQGILDLGAKADAAKADFRQGDETTRLNLLQSIDAGMDQGSALSSAIQQMKVNSEKSAADAMGTDLGNLFDTGGFIYNQSQARRGREAGQNEWWNTFSPSGRRIGGSGATGTTTRLPGE